MATANQLFGNIAGDWDVDVGYSDNRKALNDAVYKAMIEATTRPDWDKSWHWNHSGAMKYAGRHAEYIEKAQNSIGNKFVELEVPAGYEQQVYIGTTADGKKYVIEVPHSPGGNLNDYNTSGMAGWTPLGLGDLGGEGNEKTPKGTGASYIPYDQFQGLPDQTNIDNINPKGDNGLLGIALSLASIIPSPIQPFAMAANAVNSAANGNWTGAILSALGANAQFAGVGIGSDAMAMAKELATQGASISEIAQAVEGFAGVSSTAAMTTAVASTVAAQVGGVFDAVSGTIKDAAGNVIGTVEEVAQGLDGGLANIVGDSTNYTGTIEELAADGLGGNAPTGYGFELGGNMPIDEFGSLNDYGVGEDVLDDPSLWTPDENFYYDDWNMGSDSSGNMSNSSGRAWQDVAAETLRNAGFDRELAAKIVQGAGSLARQLLPNGSASDLAKLAAQFIGNNQAHNAVEDVINRYADRLEGLSPISKAERDQLGDIGMERFGRDYLGEGRDKWLYNEYANRGAGADNVSGMLQQLYSDPTQLSSFNAINDLATANTMRMQGARGTLQSGSTSNDYRNAAIKSMLELAQPMNQSLSTMYSGQQVPVQAFTALSNANTQAAQQGAGAINAASGTQSNLAAFMPTAFEASLRANPTLAGNQTIFGSAGRNSASDPSVLSQLAQFGSAAKGIKDGWTALSSLL